LRGLQDELAERMGAAFDTAAKSAAERAENAPERVPAGYREAGKVVSLDGARAQHGV
jgi:hypothetical protein